MSNVVNIQDFKKSEEKPEEEKKQTETLEEYAEMHDLADELFYEFAQRTDHDHAALYFMWCNMVDALLASGWGHEMLHGQITTAFANKQEEEDETQTTDPE